jgi:hypothetical protein
MAYGDLLSPEVIEPMIWTSLISMENQAAHLAPVASGNLRNSITIKTNKQEKQHGNSPDGLTSGVGQNEGVIGTACEYAAAVEFGLPDRPGYPAQPYLRPAADSFRRKIGQISGAELKVQMAAYNIRHPHKVKEYITK